MAGFRRGLLIGGAVGYVLGAKAGRERYEQIRSLWERVSGTPAVQQAAERTREAAMVGARRGLTVVQHGVERAGGVVRDRLHTDEPADRLIERVEGQSGQPPREGPEGPRDAFGAGTPRAGS